MNSAVSFFRSSCAAPWDALEIYVEGDTIMLRKYEPSCVFCGNAKDIIHFKGKNVCSTCARELGML